MALQEVKKFMLYVKKNREALAKYNEKMLKDGSYLFMEPSMITENYTPLSTLPENPEDDILEEIIHLDEKQKEKEAKPLEPKHGKEGWGEKIASRWESLLEEVVFDGKNKEERLEMRRHHLFGKLAEVAKEENFEVTQDDLEYYIGQNVEALIKESPDADVVWILEKLLKSFAKEDV